MQNSVKNFGIFLSIGLIIVGIFLPVPPKEIGMYSFEENGYTSYVGGDAYNIQIEASLRGGQISGAMTAKAVLISCGVILLFLSIAYSSILKNSEEKSYEIKSYLSTIATNVEKSDNKNVEIEKSVYKSKTTKFAERLAEVNSNEQIEKTWKCKCGAENPQYADSCRSCGEYK